MYLEPDHLYELDNVSEHAVYNRSDQNRLHLLIDLLPMTRGGVRVYENHQEFVASAPDYAAHAGVCLLCKAAEPGQPHGHFIVYDLATEDIVDTTALGKPIEGSNPRGGGRGFRGAVQHRETGKVFISEYSQITVRSAGLKDECDAISHPALSHIHAIAIEGNHLWAASTANDTVFCFSVETGGFVGAWELSLSTDGAPTAAWTTDPSRSVVQPGQSIFHLNAVTCHNGDLFLGGLRTSGVFVLSGTGDLRHLPGPAGSHDIAIVKEKLVVLDTVSRRILVFSLEGDLVSATELPSSFYVPEGQAVERQVRQGIAERGFLRGLMPAGGSYVMFGFSPAGVARFDIEEHTFGDFTPLSDDPHWMVGGLCQIFIDRP